MVTYKICKSLNKSKQETSLLVKMQRNKHLQTWARERLFTEIDAISSINWDRDVREKKPLIMPSQRRNKFDDNMVHTNTI